MKDLQFALYAYFFCFATIIHKTNTAGKNYCFRFMPIMLGSFTVPFKKSIMFSSCCHKKTVFFLYAMLASAPPSAYMALLILNGPFLCSTVRNS